VALATLVMVAPDAGWATDARGAYLLRTRDGGQSWQVRLASTSKSQRRRSRTHVPGASPRRAL
jgi:photosystem II stability/assembly factor-like uncharacterized protein